LGKAYTYLSGELRTILMLFWALLGVGVAAVSSPRGPVLAGYDVVAYQTLPASALGVFGLPDYIAEYDNRTWWFSSLKNMQLFQADPQRYVVAYNGFCAWGVATEYMPAYPWNWRDPKTESWRAQCMGPPCDPKTGWGVKNGRLFCAINKKYMQMFLANETLHQIADDRWASWDVPAASGIHYNVDCLQPWHHYTVCWQRLLDLGCCQNSTSPYCPGQSKDLTFE